MATILSAKNVVKTYANGHTALKDITFDVAEGEFLAIIGLSGSGKSTLLRCINLLEPIDDGVIKLDGNDITNVEINPDEVRRKIGMVFQAFNLFPHMSVLENIILAPVRVQNMSRDEAIDHAQNLLKRFGLIDKANQYPDRLSGGQQQRVAIIRSLALNPRLLLLDEITSSLDPVLVNEVLKTVRDLKAEGMTMVLATHEMGFAKQVADEVCFLKDGRILEWGPPEQILNKPQKKETQQFLKQVNEAGRL